LLLQERYFIYSEDRFWDERPVRKGRIQSLSDVMFAPLLDKNLFLFEEIEDLSVEQLVTEAGY
jgi:hypothetical protein|tara:strand:- start:859 stop:1047 length:189 start_codon:yes stop_codon:yes gene_type:complete